MRRGLEVQIRGQDAAEVGVVFELDAEHVEDFAFEPFGAGVEGDHGIDFKVAVIEEDAEDEAGVPSPGWRGMELKM